MKKIAPEDLIGEGKIGKDGDKEDIDTKQFFISLFCFITIVSIFVGFFWLVSNTGTHRRPIRQQLETIRKMREENIAKMLHAFKSGTPLYCNKRKTLFIWQAPIFQVSNKQWKLVSGHFFLNKHTNLMIEIGNCHLIER